VGAIVGHHASPDFFALGAEKLKKGFPGFSSLVFAWKRENQVEHRPFRLEKSSGAAGC
jgi:hypothetical protein